MATKNTSYDTIKSKIDSLKQAYPSLRSKTDDYVFSALCVKSHLFKNPALILNENDFTDIIVDGQYDGGVDILLADPNSESSDLIIAQSKFYKTINRDDITNASLKMALFYKDMINGHYENVNEKVQRRFLTLNAEIGEESKIHFIFYTSAPKNRIRSDQIEKKFKEQFPSADNVSLSILFGDDIEEEIKESESRRPSVESGKIIIDDSNNYLRYGDNAAIINASAFSIKSLYAQHNNNLLSKNLRYHVHGPNIDKSISETIKNEPESFWFKNNGITIICDDFRIDGKEVKLHNFSIINGGQTTYMLHKNRCIDISHDFYLPCKIIKAIGETEDEKNSFSLSIAVATNSQKAIKAVDEKANSPEQIRFGQAMREVGIFYQTKRGEAVPKEFKETYLNTSLYEVGKLCLSAIFQIPCTSRAHPSWLYLPKYYEKIFNNNQPQVAKLCRELLYIDYYFRNKFQKKFDKENSSSPNSSDRISFAHNSRTICVAFVALASRYAQGTLTNSDLQVLFNSVLNENLSDSIYNIFSNIDGIQYFIPPVIFSNKDICDNFLSQLFYIIINAGISSFTSARIYQQTSLTATNFLKKDKNYYAILNTQWGNMSSEIINIFNEFQQMQSK